MTRKRVTASEKKQRHEWAIRQIDAGRGLSELTAFTAETWGCSRRTSLRDVDLAQGELAKALDSIELHQMVGRLATQYQRLAAKAEADNQFSAAVGALNALRAMVVQPQLDRQFEVHFRGRHSQQVHQPYRR